jgi:hypothetical protein
MDAVIIIVVGVFVIGLVLAIYAGYRAWHTNGKIEK